ncbi:hypothetical protein K9F62_03105 [Desulfovibrio sp. JY]|nr:hypothetical protein K9F62_03105 [Desulfovibrio sp. JY]
MTAKMIEKNKLRDAIVDVSCIVIRLRESIKRCETSELASTKKNLNKSINSLEILCLKYIDSSKDENNDSEYPFGIDIYGEQAAKDLFMVQLDNKRLKRLEVINEQYKTEVAKAFEFIKKETKRNDKMSRENRKLKKENEELKASMRCWMGRKGKC